MGSKEPYSIELFIYNIENIEKEKKAKEDMFNTISNIIMKNPEEFSIMSISTGSHINVQNDVQNDVYKSELIDKIMYQQCHPIGLYSLDELKRANKIHIILIDPGYGLGYGIQKDLRYILNRRERSDTLVEKYFGNDTDTFDSIKSKIKIYIYKQKINLIDIVHYLDMEVIEYSYYAYKLKYENVDIHIRTAKDDESLKKC